MMNHPLPLTCSNLEDLDEEVWNLDLMMCRGHTGFAGDAGMI
jgi:hypothetical protein